MIDGTPSNPARTPKDMNSSLRDSAEILPAATMATDKIDRRIKPVTSVMATLKPSPVMNRSYHANYINVPITLVPKI